MTPRRLAPLLLVLLLGCERTQPSQRPFDAAELQQIASLSLPLFTLPKSAGNPFADDERAARLGQKLFYDERLSGSGNRSCASCHQPERYFTDGLVTSRGEGPGVFNTPSVLGAAAFTFVTWNGRHDSIWAQTLEPLEHPRELGGSRTAIAQVVAAHYRDEYESLFGPLPPSEVLARASPRATPVGSPSSRAAWEALPSERRSSIDAIFTSVGKALEAYVRRLLPGPTPFDAFAQAVASGDPRGGGHLSEEAVRGLRLFLREGACVQCHSGPLFSDGQFHNLGLPRPRLQAEPLADRSRGAKLVREQPFRCGTAHSAARVCEELEFLNPAFADFRGAFRTPSLRNVAQTAPYMHAGQFATLAEVIEFYKRLPGQPATGHRDPLLQPLGHGIATAELIAFLRALSGPLPAATWSRPREPQP